MRDNWTIYTFIAAKFGSNLCSCSFQFSLLCSRSCHQTFCPRNIYPSRIPPAQQTQGSLGPSTSLLLFAKCCEYPERKAAFSLVPMARYHKWPRLQVVSLKFQFKALYFFVIYINDLTDNLTIDRLLYVYDVKCIAPETKRLPSKAHWPLALNGPGTGGKFSILPKSALLWGFRQSRACLTSDWTMRGSAIQAFARGWNAGENPHLHDRILEREFWGAPPFPGQNLWRNN